MRVTKAQLRAHLITASAFNMLRLEIVSPRRGNQYREEQGFIPVHQYGNGMFPLRGEIGYLRTDRIIVQARR